MYFFYYFALYLYSKFDNFDNNFIEHFRSRVDIFAHYEISEYILYLTRVILVEGWQKSNRALTLNFPTSNSCYRDYRGRELMMTNRRYDYLQIEIVAMTVKSKLKACVIRQLREIVTYN